MSNPLRCYCYDRSAQYDYVRHMLCGTLEAKELLRFGPDPYTPNLSWCSRLFGGLQAIDPPYGFSNVYIPGMRLAG